MIESIRGNIIRADAEALVNTVNCVGFMGRGIALQFKQAFPRNFVEYQAACRRQDVQPGRMLVHKNSGLGGPRYIINFPTKRHWRGKSRLEDIESGLRALVTVVRDLGLTSIALPPLGAGLGGLDWGDVRPRIESAFAELPDVHVLLFEPSGPPTAAEMVPRTSPPAMTAGRAALVGLMSHYLGAMMDASVSLLEVHKLMYFLQEAGEPLKLRYVKGPYGPYAENLRQVLVRIEGHLTSGYADGGDAPDKQLSIVPGAVEEAASFLLEQPQTQRRFKRVAGVVEGFESPFGLELLASVHWVASRGARNSSEAVVTAMYEWNDRKKRFSEEQIVRAWDKLQQHSWL